MEPPESTVIFRRSKRILSRKDVMDFARLLSAEVANGRPFECLITDDRELQRLNREFLQHDYPTDVLSFPSGENEGPLGEIAISTDRAIEQAAAYGHEPIDEVRILMLHGVLHLLGYDHEADRGEMARAERKWRRKFQLPEALTERAQA
jgi:probable rRNA maturation factor